MDGVSFFNDARKKRENRGGRGGRGGRGKRGGSGGPTKIICFKCGVEGHKSYECPDKEQNNGGTTMVTQGIQEADSTSDTEFQFHIFGSKFQFHVNDSPRLNPF